MCRGEYILMSLAINCPIFLRCSSEVTVVPMIMDHNFVFFTKCFHEMNFFSTGKDGLTRI